MPRPLLTWRRCAASFGLSLVALGACAQEAVVCSLGGLPGTVVHQGGRPLQLPVQEMKPCDGLKVVAGEAVACTVDYRGRGQCLNFAKGSTITAQDLSRGGPVKGAWTAFVAMLKGNQDQKPALARGDEDGRPLPLGPVMLLDPQLQVDFARYPGLREIHVFERDGRGPRVATLSPEAGVLPVPQLRPDTSFWWQLVTHGPTMPLSGRFTLQPAADREAARAERDRLQREGPMAASARAAMWANWLMDRGCEHEARAALLAAGFELQ